MQTTDARQPILEGSDDYAAPRIVVWRIFGRELTLQFLQHQRARIRKRRVCGHLYDDFQTGGDIYGGDALNVANLGDFENDVSGRVRAHAVTCTGHIAHTAFSEAIS